MKFDEKGMLAPFTVITSFITGVLFPLLGSLIAFDLKTIESFYIEGLVLVLAGGFLTQWLLAHSVHDYYHYDKERRRSFSKKTLRFLFIMTLIVLFLIALYLTLRRGWPVLMFAIIGFIVSLYAEGLFHHESQMAIGAMFLVIGAFYVQTGTLTIDMVTWLRVFCIGFFAFFSQYGWLLFYRLDDYHFDKKKKNQSILTAKTALLFLILYLFLGMVQ